MLDWIYPQTISVVQSNYNGKIKVLKSRGKYSVWVGGFEQSGNKYVERIWREALNRVTIEQCDNVLVLGLGCGTVVPLLLKKWPKAKIVGIEIDQVMIDLGKKYFSLGKIPALTIVKQDARDFLRKNKRKFDLVLVDAYIGNKQQKLNVVGGVVITNNLVGLESQLMVKLHHRNV